MKVILIAKVNNLGDIDDIKEVSDGYAVNFLFPKHLAVPAKTDTVNNLEVQKNKQEKDEKKELKRQQKLASKLDGMEIRFKEKVSEKGVLYSSVTPQKINQKLLSLGFSIDKNQIKVESIKTIGNFKAKIKFDHGLEAELVIIVYK